LNGSFTLANAIFHALSYVPCTLQFVNIMMNLPETWYSTLIFINILSSWFS